MRLKLEQPENTVKRVSADATEWLAPELEGYVLRIARWIVQKMNLPPDLAEDLGQQGLLKYFQLNRERRASIKDRRAYLYRIVRNAALDYLADQQPDLHYSISEIDEWSEELPTSHSSDVDVSVLMLEVYDSLDSADRILFTLLIEGYAAKELALRLKITPDTARKRIERLRNKVRVKLFQSSAPSGGANAPGVATRENE
jgi:RNA polymerase sigma factor (sigma-70 family)